MLTIVDSAIVRSGVQPPPSAGRPENELDLDNFPSGDEPF